METANAIDVKLTHQNAESDFLLSESAQNFLVALHQNFEEQRQKILHQRELMQQRFAAGELPTFNPHTRHIRESNWQVVPPKRDLTDRRVEITGPVDRKMVINALNSGARVFMADFEDSNAPTWENCIGGQKNLYDAVRKTIRLETERKTYAPNDEVATLMVRPRGWHLVEKHFLIDNEPISASLFDFGLYFFHNAKYLVEQGSGPYFYLPKLEDRLEATLWNDVFLFAQDYLNLPVSTVRATVLVETITAVFQLEEILFALKEHSAGLNCGRWDYIFSIIKKFGQRPEMVMPNRDQVTMTTSCMDAYAQRVIDVCHKRGAHAMGGMAAQIPVKNDEETNRIAFEKVKNDKWREAQLGHDGTWVAHPGMVQLAMDVFNEVMPKSNQIEKRIAQLPDEKNLLTVPKGSITEDGIRKNMRVGVLYIAAWLSGTGAAAINNLMEDAATAEISRSQIWQWLMHNVQLEDGRFFDRNLYQKLIHEELLKLQVGNGYNHQWKPHIDDAGRLFKELVEHPSFEEFLTIPAYNYFS